MDEEPGKTGEGSSCRARRCAPLIGRGALEWVIQKEAIHPVALTTRPRDWSLESAPALLFTSGRVSCAVASGNACCAVCCECAASCGGRKRPRAYR